jgi:REP element-mobilizing transposase RayT
MARKLRLEFPGAIYHVINRGNYRADIFRSEGAKLAFEGCLFEACAKSGWVLHAFVLMSNHYHLALETPEGNLVAGMQWLQATFANRFNRLRGERGHLFQGRYKALLVEDGAALGQVCHYIHLNPVRAGLVTVERLGEYRHSSYWFLWQPALRPVFLHPETALAEAGDLMDEQRGWQAYEKYLDWQVAEGPAGKSQAYVPLSRGWALGSEGFKRALVKDHALAAAARAWEHGGADEIRADRGEDVLKRALRILRRTEEEFIQPPKSARWKVALAAFVKERTPVSNRWVAERMGFGRAAYASRLVSVMRRQQNPPAELTKLRAKCTT